MSAVRAAVTAALRDVLPETVRVEPYGRNIDNPTRQTVLVRQDTVEASPVAPTAYRSYSYQLAVITPLSDPTGPADDDLDALLEDVLDAIDRSPTLTWSRAERGVWLDTTLPCYQVTATTYYQKD